MFDYIISNNEGNKIYLSEKEYKKLSDTFIEIGGTYGFYDFVLKNKDTINVSLFQKIKNKLRKIINEYRTK